MILDSDIWSGPWIRNKILTDWSMCWSRDSRYREHDKDRQRGVKAYITSGEQWKWNMPDLGIQEANVAVRSGGQMIPQVF